MPPLQLNSWAWSIDRSTTRTNRGRRSAESNAAFPTDFLTDQTKVVEEFSVRPKGNVRRMGAAVPALDLTYDLAAGEAAVLAVRHPSGALRFHLPVESIRRSAGGKGQARFVVDVRSVNAEGRRGLVSKAIKAVIITVAKDAVDKTASLLLPKLAAFFEKSVWRKKGLLEGFYRVTADSLGSGKLAAELPNSTDRTLLFLHGTFSNAASAFGDLAATDFFSRVAAIYQDRIYAFNHYTISRTPEENARMLLAALPDKAFDFDVVTHSRGGLVLRNIVEKASKFGAPASRFRLGHGVLVACPNEGTPLATATRWQDTVGWLANLLELFPDNPFTTGAEFVANGIVWLAGHASGDIPGLAAMDSSGETIAELQNPPGPPPTAYSALTANYSPSGSILNRMIDAGIDQFFGSANDLVVPTEGGWRIDNSDTLSIPGQRIGCFGAGGNLRPDSVTHLNLFAQPSTAVFLAAALSGHPQATGPMDPSRSLPDRRLMRSTGTMPALLPAAAALAESNQTPSTKGTSIGARSIMVDGARIAASDTFHLVVLPASGEDKHKASILAHYGSARVLADFRLGGAEDNAGKRWQTIIGYNERIRDYVSGRPGPMPNDRELQDFGSALFDTLFPGSVRRLYDTARSLQRERRLNVILTSMISWVADKPWEFSYDPVRRTSLATEDLHFFRNVITAVPAEIIEDRQRLRILVASSQPIRMGTLSVEEEESVIRRGFEPLREAGLADVEVLARATPASLHNRIATGQYSVVHFIGHGEYDADSDKGYLIFQDEQGNPYPVSDRSAREIFCGRGLRLVFLNACETGQGGHADFNSGVAPALVAGGVPIVVANQYKVLDTSATFFAKQFYWSLAQGMTVAEAARESRIAVNYSLSGEPIDWAVPVVYARDPNSRLAAPQAIDLLALPPGIVRASSRRKVARHKSRVAVWDVSSQFPALKATLARMNEVQEEFGFEIVDLSVPVDAWHVHQRRRFLDADRFAERLAPAISQLGVRYLCVIVDEYMVHAVATGHPTYYIYGWWPDTKTQSPPVLIFSTKGLKLASQGRETDRALANVAVSGIAGYTMDSGTHEKGPRDCPNYYNPERRIELLAGHQRFCAVCLRRLRGHHAVLKALNAILSAFD